MDTKTHKIDRSWFAEPCDELHITAHAYGLHCTVRHKKEATSTALVRRLASPGTCLPSYVIDISFFVRYWPVHLSVLCSCCFVALTLMTIS